MNKFAALSAAALIAAGALTSSEAEARIRRGGVAAGVVGGLAAGALIGAAMSNAYAAPGYPYDYDYAPVYYGPRPLVRRVVYEYDYTPFRKRRLVRSYEYVPVLTPRRVRTYYAPVSYPYPWAGRTYYRW